MASARFLYSSIDVHGIVLDSHADSLFQLKNCAWYSTVDLSRRDRYCMFLASSHGRRKVDNCKVSIDVAVQPLQKLKNANKNGGKREMAPTPSPSGNKPLVENVGPITQKPTKALKRSTAGPACKKAKLQERASMSSPLTSKS